MDEALNSAVKLGAAEKVEQRSAGAKAFNILRTGYTIAPIAAGIDKFFGVLVDWDKYLPPFINQITGGRGHQLMLVVGVIEIAAGVGVFLKPKIFSWVVAAWLFLIIVNLLMVPGYYDVALRDLGLMFGAAALGILSGSYAE
ncbi:MAG: hypothetical protein KIS76_11030 [Pyrinomonadaceae bacterium]|nr:hypothetical protein [Pyrinomonadaceae bacterium]